jgi:hypothetical protein
LRLFGKGDFAGKRRLYGEKKEEVCLEDSMSTVLQESPSNDVVAGAREDRTVSDLLGFSEHSWTMIEKQIDHRQFLEKQLISAAVKRKATGQTMAFVLALTAFGIGGATLILHEISVGFGRRGP